jgi:hypothetical protein
VCGHPHARNEKEEKMKLRTQLISGALSGALALGLIAPAASAAPVGDTPRAAVAAVGDERPPAELASSLEALFEDAIVIDSSGIVSFDEAKVADVVGEEEAAKLAASFRDTQARGSLPQARAAAGNDFVNCMVENSVIGLVSGVVSGSFAELIREKKWDELAEKLWPKLVRSGFAGGVVGVAASLAAGAVQCSLFDD